MGPLIFAILLALVVSFVCSICEAVLLSTTRAQAEAFGDSRAGRILRKFKREVDRPIAAILILNTGANVFGAAMAGVSFEALYGADSLTAFTAGFTIALLFFGEIIPKTVGAVHTKSFIVPVVYFVRGLTFVLWPMIWLSRQLTRAIRGKRVPITSLKEIRILAELGMSEGAVEEHTAKMIDGAARLKELSAYDVMVPRTASSILFGGDILEKSLSLMSRTGHSRFPYSRVGNPDRIDGVVHTRDVLSAINSQRIFVGDTAMSQASSRVLDSLIRKVQYVPESTSVLELLRMFQETRNHQAIVVDEYGGTEGIVTLEDVIEEVVGEIQDERDSQTTFIVHQTDGSLLCRGRAETRRVFEEIDESDEAESVTLAGYLAERLGRVPVAGDRVALGLHEFHVQRANARRADRILVEKLSLEN